MASLRAKARDLCVVGRLPQPTTAAKDSVAMNLANRELPKRTVLAPNNCAKNGIRVSGRDVAPKITSDGRLIGHQVVYLQNAKHRAGFISHHQIVDLAAPHFNLGICETHVGAHCLWAASHDVFSF